MEYREELLWILDKPGTDIHNQDEQFRENIEFVHSLGLKCDSVGWCKLDLANPRTEEIFEKITAFCREKGWKARCWYTRRYADVESDWFALEPTYFKDNTPTGVTDQGTRTIRAFYESKVGPKSWGMDLFVPERFRNCCIQNGWDLDFCWAKDLGKYEAEQYFHVYGKNLISQVAVDFDLRESDRRIRTAGGWLPRIADVFHTKQMIDLPDCYLAQDLPEGGIGYVYIPRTYSCSGRNTILIHKAVAKVLLREKAISAGALQPVPVVDALPGGYVLEKTQPIPRPEAAFMEQMLAEYGALKGKKRPVRAITEKEALKLLRGAKKERKADFQKAMPKAKGEALGNSVYGPMAAYYLIADGGWPSEEYQLLPYEKAVAENDAFHRQLETEELLEEKPQGVVIAGCPDGDAVLLCQDGSVIRFSHEAPEVTEKWQSLAQFVAEAVNA